MYNEKIDTYLLEILEAKINLTSITNLQEAKILHIEDSLAALPEVNRAPEGLYGDMGSGGGFPGVPIAIESKRQTVLIESIKKKSSTVQEILEKLGLDQQITTYNGRLEELAKEQPNTFAVLTARALSKLPSLLELAAPLLQKGGYLICLKAHEEIDHAIQLQDKLGMKLINRRNFYLSDKYTYREIITFEKFSEPQIKLPRRNGLAQKNPL